MNRLIKKAEEKVEDKYLSSAIEIINTKSKYNGYFGWIDEKYHNEKYKVLVKPMFEHDGNKWIPMYVEYHKIERWVQIVDEKFLED